MIRQPYAITTFCDDIRQEFNGKITLVGCYLGEMMFNGAKPGRSPIFATLTRIMIPSEYQFKLITIKVTKFEGDVPEELASMDIQPEPDPNVAPHNDVADSSEDSPYNQFAIPFQFSPFEMKDEGKVTVRVYIDGIELKAGALAIKFISQDV